MSTNNDKLHKHEYVSRETSDYADFIESFITKTGLTDIEKIIYDNSDLIDDEQYGIRTGKSEIHGVGMFAEIEFAPSDEIALGRIGENRTLAGRYINHSPSPNAMFDLDFKLMALAEIKVGEEITTSYRATHAQFSRKRRS